jgi:hypothetical protein
LPDVVRSTDGLRGGVTKVMVGMSRCATGSKGGEVVQHRSITDEHWRDEDGKELYG